MPTAVHGCWRPKSTPRLILATAVDPVLNDNKIVGIVMQGISNADNIGYMIPAPVVKRFHRRCQQ